MAVPSSILDGSAAYGIQQFTFANAGVYTAENVSVDRPVQTASDRTSAGLPQNSRYTVDYISLTATLQVPGNAAVPQFGDTITQQFDANYGNETFVLMPVPFVASNDPAALRKIDITMRKQNTATLTVIS